MFLFRFSRTYLHSFLTAKIRTQTLNSDVNLFKRREEEKGKLEINIYNNNTKKTKSELKIKILYINQFK